MTDSTRRHYEHTKARKQRQPQGYPRRLSVEYYRHLRYTGGLGKSLFRPAGADCCTGNLSGQPE